MKTNIIDFSEQRLVKGESPKPILLMILKIAGTIMIGGMLLDVWLDGFSFGLLSKYLLPLFLLSYGLNAVSAGQRLVEIKNNIKVDNGELIYGIYGILEKGKEEDREVLFKFNKISKVQYSNKTKILTIEGYPRIVIKNLKSGKEHVTDLSEKKSPKSIDIGLNSVNGNEVIKKIKEVCNIDIERID